MPAPAAALNVDTIGYVRVSTEDQAGERKTSLADQRAALHALAGQLGRRLRPEAVFVDPGVSGGSASGRPGFMALVAYCEARPRAPGALGFVLVLNDSRWGRFPNPEENTYWRFRLELAGWVVRFVEAEAEDPLARAVLRTVHSAQASAWRQAIRENSKRGARAAARKGLWQNEAPLGYRRCATDAAGVARILEPAQRKGDHEETRLVPGPAPEQDLVRYAFTTFDGGGVSLGALIRDLAVRWPAKRWSRATLGALLRNPVYVGDVVWCRRGRDDRTHQQHPQPADAWVVATDAHPALIDRALFARVQARLAANRRTTRAVLGGYPLSGFIRCAQCGGVYIGGGGPKGPPGDPDRYRFYRCNGADAGRCPGPTGTLQKRWIEPRVTQLIAAALAAPSVQTMIRAELERRLAALAADAPVRRGTSDDAVRRLEAERVRVAELAARGVLQDDEAGVQLARIRAELATAKAAQDQQRFAERRQRASGNEREQLIAVAGRFGDMMRRAPSGALQRELLRPWIHRMVVDKHKRKLVVELRVLPALAGILGSVAQGGRG